MLKQDIDELSTPVNNSGIDSTVKIPIPHFIHNRFIEEILQDLEMSTLSRGLDGGTVKAVVIERVEVRLFVYEKPDHVQMTCMRDRHECKTQPCRSIFQQ